MSSLGRAQLPLNKEAPAGQGGGKDQNTTKENRS